MKNPEATYRWPDNVKTSKKADRQCYKVACPHFLAMGTYYMVMLSIYFGVGISVVVLLAYYVLEILSDIDNYKK